MNKEQLEKRKKLIAELILENEFYVPMKTKEIAILLQIPKSQITAATVRTRKDRSLILLDILTIREPMYSLL